MRNRVGTYTRAKGVKEKRENQLHQVCLSSGSQHQERDWEDLEKHATNKTCSKRKHRVAISFGIIVFDFMKYERVYNQVFLS